MTNHTDVWRPTNAELSRAVQTELRAAVKALEVMRTDLDDFDGTLAIERKKMLDTAVAGLRALLPAESTLVLESPAYLAVKKERDDLKRKCSELMQAGIDNGVGQRQEGRREVLAFLLDNPMTGEDVYKRIIAVVTAFVQS